MRVPHDLEVDESAPSRTAPECVSPRSPANLSSSNSPFLNHQKKPSGFVFIAADDVLVEQSVYCPMIRMPDTARRRPSSILNVRRSVAFDHRRLRLHACQIVTVRLVQRIDALDRPRDQRGIEWLAPRGSRSGRGRPSSRHGRRLRCARPPETGRSVTVIASNRLSARSLAGRT